MIKRMQMDEDLVLYLMMQLMQYILFLKVAEVSVYHRRNISVYIFRTNIIIFP